MKMFTFNRGAWDTGHNIQGAIEGECNLDHFSRAGYLTNSVCYGTGYGSRLEIFEHETNGSFLALVWPTGRARIEVLVPDFQSYMLFMKDYGGSFAAAGVDATQKVITETVEKLFQASHGHDWSESCRLCDPVGWRRWKKMPDLQTP